MKKIFRNAREFLKFKLFRPLLLNLGNSMGKYSTAGDHAIFDNREFKWAEDLENNWETIRKELESVLAFKNLFPNLQDIQKEQKILNQDDNWKTFFLYGFGHKATMNCQSCPVTTSIIEHIPGMKTAFFSVLSPHKHIPSHKGIFKGIIRSHLGLIIPGKPGDCVMRIEKDHVNWKEGKVVIFDDTCEHEVWNNTPETRVVLLVDVKRPFKFPLSIINNAVIQLIGNSSHAGEAKKNHELWENRFYNDRTKNFRAALNPEL